ncbi:MAG: anthranilate phosphoribosyltransferase [Thermoanaerobaculia bacterium]
MNPDVLLIRKMMSRQNLTRAESAELLEAILRTDDEGWKLLAYSVASQTKGETVEEILGMFDAMRRLTGEYDLDLSGRRPMDISTAGGSGVKKINVSTLSALVAGDPIVPVIKHSFWRVSGLTGSADALEAVGLHPQTVTLPQIQKAVETVGVVYYSPLFVSGELRNIVNFGRILGEKGVGLSTPFHLLAPVFTPIPLTYRMFGLNNPTQFEILTEIFRGLGYRNALLVRGFEGLDEASISSPSRVRGFRGEEDFDFVLLPEEAGLKRASQEEVTPVDAESNYRDFLRIAHGQETGPKRDLIAINAGLALWISERTPTIAEGVQMALERLASGMAAERLTALVEQHGSPDVLRRARETYLDS